MGSKATLKMSKHAAMSLLVHINDARGLVGAHAPHTHTSGLACTQPEAQRCIIVYIGVLRSWPGQNHACTLSETWSCGAVA